MYQNTPSAPKKIDALGFKYVSENFMFSSWKIDLD